MKHIDYSVIKELSHKRSTSKEYCVEVDGPWEDEPNAREIAEETVKELGKRGYRAGYEFELWTGPMKYRCCFRAWKNEHIHGL